MPDRSKRSRPSVVFRVDSSTEIGTGHVMRCLTLADQLRRAGRECLFVCRELPGNLGRVIRKQGFALSLLKDSGQGTECSASIENEYARWLGVSWSDDAAQALQAIVSAGCSCELLVIDHYGIDYRWEEILQPAVGRLMVIDDLANRRHTCDLLLDQNLHRDMKDHYRGLVPSACLTFLGPSYALLRPQFEVAYQSLPRRDGTVRRMFIFMGGADPSNETSKALDAIGILNRPEIAVDVVVGESNPHRHDINQIVSGMRSTTFHCQVDNIAELMAKADLAIGAGGTSAWERCYLGLPSLMMVLAQNQEELALSIAEAGAGWNLGWAHAVTADQIVRALVDVMSRPDELLSVAQRAESLMHGESDWHTPHLLSALLSGALI